MTRSLATKIAYQALETLSQAEMRSTIRALG
jgi:hypothetical protein